MDPELREYLEAMEQRLTTKNEDGDRETRVLLEAVGDDVKKFAEDLSGWRQGVEPRLADHEKRITKLERRRR